MNFVIIVLTKNLLVGFNVTVGSTALQVHGRFGIWGPQFRSRALRLLSDRLAVNYACWRHCQAAPELRQAAPSCAAGVTQLEVVVNTEWEPAAEWLRDTATDKEMWKARVSPLSLSSFLQGVLVLPSARGVLTELESVRHSVKIFKRAGEPLWNRYHDISYVSGIETIGLHRTVT